MSNLQEITDAIDDRLSELKQQIASLEAARRALTDIQRSRPAESKPTAGTRAPAKARRSRAATSRRPAASVPASPSVSASASASAAAAPATAKPARSSGTRPAAAKASTARTRKSSPKRRRRELEPGQIEGLLRESEDGLSLVALARRAEVSEVQVADRLATLERSGEARRSGPRRTSLWRLVTDEERIAERAAELARASQSKT
jgi:hypothetical protein